MSDPVTTEPGGPKASVTIGYVLIDPNTDAMDWDGVVYSRYDDAVGEAVKALNIRDGERWERPPSDAGELWYEVVEVRHVAGSTQDVLRKAQQEWRREWEEFVNG